MTHPLRFLARGERYRFWGAASTPICHLFHAGEGRVFLLGTDELGRDLFSRILAGSRVSLTIGLVGVMISFVLGCLLGGISGYFGGLPDLIIQRLIEIFNCHPRHTAVDGAERGDPGELAGAAHLLHHHPDPVGARLDRGWRAWCAASCWSCASTTT